MKYISDILNISAESELVEFREKVSHNNYEKWAKVVVAMANTGGGAIYFGVDKSGAILGLEKVEKEYNFLNDMLKSVISPNVETKVEKILATNTKTIIRITVSKANEPIFLRKEDGSYTIYLRKGKETIPASIKELKEMLESKVVVKTVSSFVNKPTKYDEEILAFCAEPRKRKEIQDHIGISSRPYFRQNILVPLIEKGLLIPTNPNPRASNQKYIVKK